MIQLRNIIPLKGQRPSTILGLELDGSRLEGIVLRRTNGSVQVLQSFSVLLSLDPLTADPELVGREIRNHLDAAGVRERQCVVGLPLKWALIAQIEIPELAEGDVESFLHIEGERSFPCDVETLLVASSRCQLPAGKPQAMLVGIPRSHLALLEEVLSAARLRPLSFGLGIMALQPATADSAGVLALAIGETSVSLQMTCGGGLAALRTVDGALAIEGGRRILNAGLVARETRITLGQLLPEVRENIRRVRVFGPRDLAQQLADELELRFEATDLKIELAQQWVGDDFGVQLPADAPVSAAFGLAAHYLAGRPAAMEFLPPKVTAWQELTARYSSGKLRFAGLAGAAVLLLVAGLFGIQQWQLMRLTKRWNQMSAEVQQLQTVQEQIRQFRPWFDDSVRGLSILRHLTAAFPEDGVVAAKTVEIRDLTGVTCSGTARDNQSLLKTLDRLRATGGITDLKVDQIRGRSPLQFTFDFRWNEGAKNEN
jgi:hypothetical protein